MDDVPVAPAGRDSWFADLVRQYGRLVRTAVRRVGGPIVRQAADDIEQNVWLAVWKARAGEQDVTHASSYLYTVARREAVRAVKEELSRQARQAEVASDTALGTREMARHAQGDRETRDRIARALATLAPDRRRAVAASLNGLDVQEIMDLYGWPYERARNLIARGRADLRAAMKDLNR